jgi:hypothetical protein
MVIVEPAGVALRSIRRFAGFLRQCCPQNQGSDGEIDPLHPRAIAAVEPFSGRTLAERVSDISGRTIGSRLP